MSSVIEVRLYGDEHAPPAASLGKIARAVSAWSRFEGQWHGIHALNARKEPVAEEDAPMSNERLQERALEWNGAHRTLVAEGSAPFWRFADDGSPHMGRLPLDIMAWDRTFGRFSYSVPQLDGYARILIDKAAPFYAVLGPQAAHPDVVAINACVQDNVDALLELISIVRGTVSPASVKVFDDEGLRLPFNAHYAWYRDAVTLAGDLRCLADAWENGLRWYPDDPPLKSFQPSVHAIYLHLSRSEAERERLHRRLAGLLPRAAALSDEAVKQALSKRPAAAATGELELCRREFFATHFVDEALLDILGAAVTA